jgi:D-lyxose ketol-isomerase
MCQSVAVAVMYFDNQIAAAAIDNVFHFLRMIRDGDGLAHSAVAVTLDGMRQSHVAGSQLRLSPGAPRLIMSSIFCG